MTDKKNDLEAPVETEEKQPPTPPHRLKDRVRVCGKWQKKGYRPSAAELKDWNAKCKRFNLDPKTGAPKKAKK